jgi:prephenate dehydratase
MIEGSVNATLDELCFGPPGAYLRGEVRLPVALHLLGPPGAELARRRTIRSHPVALAQCRQWLRAHLPQVLEEAETSTAEAARLVSLTRAADGEAAVAPRLSADRFGLEVLAPDIHDITGNVTRFGVLGRSMAAPTGADKTSLVVFFGDDRPGLLLKVLEEFALRSINLTKIESRPMKTSLGEYCILIDAEGHPTEARMAEALRSVHRHVAELRVFGAYPRADAIPPQVSPSDTDAAYAEAVSWHRRLLDDVDSAD